MARYDLAKERAETIDEFLKVVGFKLRKSYFFTCSSNASHHDFSKARIKLRSDFVNGLVVQENQTKQRTFQP